jgi:PKD repeat protein
VRTWKFVLSIIASLAVFFLCIYFFLPPFSHPAFSLPISTTVTVIADDVFVQKEGSDIWERVEGQASLEEGDWVKTSSTGQAAIAFFEGSSTVLEPDTIVCIEELLSTIEGSTTVIVNQQVGKTWNRVGRLVDPASSFEVQTSAAAAVARGTLIDVQVEENGTTVVKVFGDKASVIAQGQEVAVAAGCQTTVDPGKPPPPPTSLPASLSQLNVSIESPAWLHVIDPLGRDAGIVPPGFNVDEIPYTITAGALGEKQSVDINEPIGGSYYIIMYARDHGSVELTVNGTSQGGFAQQEARAFDVERGKNYYVYLDLVVRDGQIQCFWLGDVKVLASPHANFTADKTIAARGEAIQFTDLSTGNPASWWWDFGDGTGSTQRNPSHIYTSPGNYTVRLTVSNPAGKDNMTETITVYSRIMIELTWDTNATILDSHFIAPNHTMWDSFYDCYRYNRNPDWDGSGNLSPGDPVLVIDDTYGYGTEYVFLPDPPYNGTYQYKVYYSSAQCPCLSEATVKIWIDGELVFTKSKALSQHETWDCAYIEWPSGNVYSSLE